MDQVVKLLVNGVTRATMEARAEELFGIKPAGLARYLDEARRRITLAADYDRDAEIGRAILALDDLYTRSLTIQDTKTAISALSTRIKLLGLAAPQRLEQTVTDATAAAETQTTAAAALAHLAPLDLPAAQDDLVEQCRLAAREILTARATAKPAAKTTKKPGRRASPRKRKTT